MTKLWAAVVGAAPQLAGWIGRGSGGLDVARLPRPAWPIVAGAVARAITERGVSVVILLPGPDRFADDLRVWLAGNPGTHVFDQVGGSLLGRAPALEYA